MTNHRYDNEQVQYEKAMLITALQEQVTLVLRDLITKEEAVIRAKQLAAEWIHESQTDTHFEFHFDATPSTFDPKNQQHINCLNALKQLIED